jgi:ATP-dependent RNA helicase DeaD
MELQDTEVEVWTEAAESEDSEDRGDLGTPAESPDDVALARIPEPLRNALKGRGYEELTAVQHAVLALESAGRDLQISSQTGSGKTVALGILIADELIAALEEDTENRPRALVITPTRELAMQVQKELHWLYAGVAGLSVAVVTGGTNVGMERRALKRMPMVVVGTPGRMFDHIRSGVLSCSNVSRVVLDEADQMLDMGFREELEGILDTVPEERTTHLVSATFPSGIQKLALRYQRDPLHVEGTQLGKPNEDIEHVAHLVREQDRYQALVNLLLLAEDERVLIFVNTRADTAEIAEALSKDGIPALPLSGELQQLQRTRTLTAFRAGSAKVLVATDVAARGLDITDVNTVIQAATPNDSDIYIHRGGRTGRAGQKGRCVLLVPSRREGHLRRLLKNAGIDSDWRDIPTKEQVEKALAKRSRKRIFAAVDDEQAPDEADLVFAQKLVEARDPVLAIATLLRLARPADRCAAMDVRPPEANSQNWKHRDDRYSPERRGPRFRPGGGPAGAGGDFVRFEVNWGFRGGANPSRLLAMVCRRGGVPGRMIGSINLTSTVSSFEVRSSVASEFEKRSGRPDPREPAVQIRRARNGAGPPQKRGYGQKGGYKQQQEHRGGGYSGKDPRRGGGRASARRP